MVNNQPDRVVRCTSCGEVVEPYSRHYCTVTVGHNPVPLPDLEAALDALIAKDAPPTLEETDITVMRLATRAKCGSVKAKKMLNEWTDAGEAEYIGKRRDHTGRKVDAWRLVTK